jgi:hypothetical protein
MTRAGDTISNGVNIRVSMSSPAEKQHTRRDAEHGRLSALVPDVQEFRFTDGKLFPRSAVFPRDK